MTASASDIYRQSEPQGDGRLIAAFAVFTTILGVGLILVCFALAVQSAPSIATAEYESPVVVEAAAPAPVLASLAPTTAAAPRTLEGFTSASSKILAASPDILTLPALSTVDIVAPAEARQVKIKSGDTLAEVLLREGVGARDAALASDALSKVFNLKKLRAGQDMSVTVAPETMTPYQLASMGEDARRIKLLGLEFRPELERRVGVEYKDGAFAGVEMMVPLVKQAKAVKGEIYGSLYNSAMSAGMSENAIANLVRMFAYDVDFQREIRAGDGFEAVFEGQYDEDGTLVKTGEVLYGALTLRGKKQSYYRFVAPGEKRPDYFDENGRSAKKFLMKTPVDGARLSSGFGMRKHPILGYRKAHKGVDFAAPTGTPIMAAGDGVVEYAGKKGTFGNYVRIRHDKGYKTAYAHMHRIRVKKGASVNQGDVIGTVGSTGRSTGPHLHYEVHVNGKQVNPMNLKVATGRNLSGSERVAFMQERARIDAMRTQNVDLASAAGNTL